jgi:hypothetical protein
MAINTVPPLEIHARQSISRLRGAFGAMLATLPGRPQRPHEIQKALGIDAKLGWKIAKLVHEDDLFLSAQHLPGERRLETLFKAAAKHHVPEAMIAKARDAVSEFESLIEIHAGDRASMEMMLLGCSARSNRDAVIAQRKAAFQANSFIWGVQAKAQFGIYIMRPGDDPSWGHVASVRGFISLRRMRPNVPWVVSRLRTTDEEDNELIDYERRPLDDTYHGATGENVLPQFCSQPLPVIERIVHTTGFAEEVLAPSDVGNTAAIDCVTGDDDRNIVPRHQMEGESVWGGLRMLRTPVETLILDQLVHEDLFGAIEPRLVQFSDLGLARGYPAPPLKESELMDSGEVVQHFGKDPTAIYTPEIPRYAEMVKWVCQKIDCDPARLNVYRVRIDYPVIPTSIGMEHDLPEHPHTATD